MIARKKPMTRGEKVCAFMEKYLIVPEGDLMGQPLKLMPFQRDWLLAVFDNPHGTHTAILSIGRKNGKTALIAGVLLAFIAGPEAVENSQIVSGAMSLEQAALVFDLACQMINLSPELSARIKIFPSGRKLLGISKNVRYKALSADAKTKHGLSPLVIVLDELGQVRGPSDPFVSTLQTAQGAYENAMQLIISTQAPTDVDMLSQMIDAQRDVPDPHIVCHVYEAPPDAALGDEDGWRAANPALGVFRSITDMRKLCAKAKATPSFEPEFRNLNLNTRTEATAPFVSRSIWEANGAEPTRRKRPRVFGGLDLASTHDLTALVLVDADDGSVYPWFWLPEHGLAEKADKDKVPWVVWRDQGFLLTTPGKAVQYRYVAQHLCRIFAEFDVELIGFDRYHMQQLRPWLDEAGMPQSQIDAFVEFGQGTKSMTPALRELEVRLLEGQLKHGNHTVLSMCAANAKVIGDSDARKFDKRTARGRIDGMVALAMAIGVMPQETEEKGGTLDDYLNDMIMA
jgi:phage terminase large subunit-like protein